MAAPLLLYVFFTTGIAPKQITIRWCQGFSSFFTVSNGAKQGVILSPHVFNVYMDDFREYKSQQIGYLYAGTLINHLMYVDIIIINNSLTDDDHIARQKNAFMHKLMF